MIHPKKAFWLVWSLYSLTKFSEAVTHECVPGKYQNPVVWVHPGDSVEIRSPKNFVVTETETLSCKWEIRAQWGSKLEIKVTEKNVNYNCWDNQLTLQSKKNPPINYKAACNKDNFPSLLKTIVDDGPILVNFKSNSNDGSVKFKITFTSVDPPKIPENWKYESSCPDGPCCSGKDCCVFNVDKPEETPDLGGNDTSLMNGLYDMTSSEISVPRKNCIAKLRAPPGFQVSVNFQQLNMLESADGTCEGDYVKLYEPEVVKTTTFSLIGNKGLRFCGQHLPNSPAPSIFTSSGTDLYVQYKTDDTERKRGVNYGFKLTATAINPLVTMAKFSHKYGEKTCQDTCKPRIPKPQPTTTTTTPTPDECLKRNNKIFITEAEQPHDYIPNAKILFRTESNDEIKKFEKFTNNDGLIDFTTDKDNKIESGQVYFLTIITKDYVEKTIDVHLHCEKKTGKICPSCYFYKKVTPPSTTPAPPPETSPREASEKVTKATPKAPTEAPSVKPGKTTATKKVGKATTAPKTPAATKVPVATTVQKLPSATSGKPVSTTISNKVEKSTTVRNIPGTTLPPDEERFPSCEDKDSVNSVNQLICDCTETKCDAAILKKTGECEPCIEVPVVEPPTTPTVTPCDGDDCTTEAPTTKCIDDRNVIINVTDANSKEPVSEALVVLSHEKTGFVGVEETNAAGQASLEVSLDGKFRVKITKEGYKSGYGNAVLNCNTTTVDIKLIPKLPCENFYLMLKARREIINRGSGKYRRIYKFLKVNKNGKIGYEGEAEKRTQVLLNSKDATDIKGTQKRRHGYVLYDVTGMIPNTFTFTLTDVRGPHGGYEDSTTSLTYAYDKCSANSRWISVQGKKIRECCIKQHKVQVTIRKNTDIPPPPCGTLPQYFHVRVCGEPNYRAYGDPSITLGATTIRGDYKTIQDKVKISTIANQITTNDENLKCPGKTTLIKEYMYYFLPQNLVFHESTFIIKVNEEKNINGEGFEATQASKYVYCPNLEIQPLLVPNCYCNGTIQVVVVPKKCHNEYFTIVIKDAGTDTILPGVTITVTLISGKKYAEQVTNEQGLVNIKMDRAIKQLKLSISKTGYDTNDKETLAVNCNQKECGECQLKLTTTINKHECPDPMNVTVTVTTPDGKAVPNTPITLVLVGETETGTSRQVKERTTTDNFGQRTLVIRENGRYQIQVKSENNIDKIEEFVIDKCEHKDVEFELPPISTKSTSPPCNGEPGCTTQISTIPPCEEANNVQITFNVRDVSLTNTDKNGEPLKNASIVVEYIQKKGQQSNHIKISNSKLRTDSKGVLKVPATTNGNYTYSLSKKGYLKDPTVGFIIVDCDPDKGCNCSPVVNISVKEPKCDPIEYPQNLFINVTDGIDHTCIPGAEVILTLKSHGGTVKTEEIGRKTTPEDCIVSYLRPVNGKYDIEIKKKNYIKYQEEMDYHCNPEECQTCNVSIAVPLEKEFCDNITMKVTVIDAENNTMPIIGAKFSMTMEGADSGVVKHIDRKEIPSNGVMYVKLDKNGIYHYTVEAPGYITYTDTHKVNITLENCETYLPIRPTVITHPPKENCTRASLTWTKTPLDLDLYTFRVMYSDSSKHCQTFFCNEKQLCGCTTFDTENVYQGDQGAETITLCCKDIFSYMIYVDNRQIQNMSLADSGARITLFSNIKTEKVDMKIPTSGIGEYQRYWIAGCLVAGDGDFTYIPVNLFTVNQPSSAEPLLCHNLVNTLREKKKRDNFPKDAQIQVSAIDIGKHENIPGVSIKLAAMRNNKIVQQEKITADGTSRADSKLSFPLGENGRYKVTAEKNGYTSAPVYSTINCETTTCTMQPITMYMLEKLTPGDIRISLTYQEDRPYYLSLFQVNKLNSKESCDAIKGYDPLKKSKKVCTGMELEWSSYPGITKFGNENGDSILLRDASSNEKYTYIIYVAKINIPDDFTYLTISDSKNDKVLKVKASTSNSTQEIFWVAGCLSIKGTSFHFVEKDLWLSQDPTIDGRTMCHSIFTDTNKPAIWTEPPPFCAGSSLTVIAKDINGNIIENVNTTTTSVLDYSIEYDIDGPKPDLVLEHTINQLADKKLAGNGVYTTKVEAQGYVTDRVERRVNCDINECEKCSKTTNIVLVKQAEIDTGDTILTVTSQTGAKLLFVVYKSDNGVKLEKNDKQDRITIPYGTKNTKITIAVTQDITETGKLSQTDAVFTLRYGDNLLRLKLPLDAYHNEKYWLIGSIKIKHNKQIEFFSDNFYANVLDVFGSVPRSIGMTLPAVQPAKTDYRLHATSDCENLKILADGTELASLVPPSSDSHYAGTDTSGVLVPKDTTTIQIQCSRNGPSGGIIASADNGLKTDATWTCSTDSGATWKTASILDRKGKYYIDDSKHISNDAEVIWWHDFKGDGWWNFRGDILCKTKIDPEY